MRFNQAVVYVLHCHLTQWQNFKTIADVPLEPPAKTTLAAPRLPTIPASPVHDVHVMSPLSSIASDVTSPPAKQIASLDVRSFHDLFGITVNSCFLQDFWNVKSVPELLHKLSLEVYIPAFEKEEIDLATLLTMSEKDLESLGLNKFGPRRRLKKGNGNVPIIDHVRRQMKYRCCNEFMDICCQRKRYACTFDETK